MKNLFRRTDPKSKRTSDYDTAKLLFETRSHIYDGCEHGWPMPRPDWIPEGDPLLKIYDEAPKLLDRAKIVYAAVVGAAPGIYEDGEDENETAPGGVLYSMDHYYDYNPAALCAISDHINSYSCTEYIDQAPDNVRPILRLLMKTRVIYRLKLPVSMTRGREVYFSSILFFRCHLPNGKLDCELVPIFAWPKEFETCIMLPSQFWADELKTLALVRTNDPAVIRKLQELNQNKNH